MTDRELLELAARAVGYGIERWNEIEGFLIISPPDRPFNLTEWNPLTDDGDALRLAVKLEIAVHYSEFIGEAEARFRRGSERLAEYGPDDPCATTRRAIVRAAAMIGSQMDAPTTVDKEG